MMIKKLIKLLKTKDPVLAKKVSKVMGVKITVHDPKEYKKNRKLKTKEDVIKLAKRIEKDTGYKTGIKKYPLKSSMRGYVMIYLLKKKGGGVPEWDFDYGRKLLKEFESPEPYPTFVNNNYMFDYYIGNDVYNWNFKQK